MVNKHDHGLVSAGPPFDGPTGNDHTSVVPEDWTGWLPPHPEEQLRAATANSKSNRQIWETM